MDKICKNCISWERFDNPEYSGSCEFNTYEKNLKGGKRRKIKIAYIIFCGEQFGCVNFKEGEK